MRLVMKQYNKKKDVNKNVNLWMKEKEWYNIFIYQILSEKFIEKFKDKVLWDYISIYQKLSEAFIEKYKNKVDWYYIFKKQKLSPEFRERWKHKCFFK